MSVLEEVIKNIARVTRCSESDLKPETELKAVKADSLQWVQIIVGIESALNIEIDIDRDRMAKLETIGDFADYVSQFCAEKDRL
ncbi:MAG: acyl carrier protein [Dehalococcoidales bacterium]|nr:acyl carrier protein [Dehalococcoidales bacterium]